MAAGDIKLAYGSAADVTITLASLPPSSTLLVGAESNAIDNGTNLYLDYLVSGHFLTNAVITAGGRIEVWAIASYDDGTNWPDGFDGVASAETIIRANVKNAICRLVVAIQVDANGTYYFSGVSIASVFGGVVPRKYVLFVTHNTHASNQLDSSAGAHKLRVQPVYETVAAA